MKKILGSVKIAGRQYKVNVVKNQAIIEELTETEGAVGCCSFMRQEIYVLQNEETHEDFVTDTFLHEIVHALLYHYMPKEEIDEESMTILLTTALTSLIRDNPKLIGYFGPESKEAVSIGRNKVRKINQAESSSSETELHLSDSRNGTAVSGTSAASNVV